jgi:hypothetical protein
MYVPVAMPGAEKLLFPEEKLFSKGIKSSQRSFFKLDIMFSAYNRIHFLAVSFPDHPKIATLNQGRNWHSIADSSLFPTSMYLLWNFSPKKNWFF